MARLSKHGQELLRIEREINIPDGDLTTWERKTIAVMADGVVLEKRDVRFKPSQYDPRPSVYSYGWKIRGKAKVGKTAQDVVASYLKRIAEKPELNYQIVKGGRPPVMISERRILAAIESGDNVGFCKECGDEVTGVEPDARGYHCESCGAMAVYGAEEMLISA